MLRGAHTYGQRALFRALPSVCSQCVSTKFPWLLFVFSFVSRSLFFWCCPKLNQSLLIRLRCLIAHHGKCVSAPLFQPHVVRFGVLVNQCCSCCSSLSTACQYLCYLTKLFQWEWGLFEAVCLDSFGEFFISLRKNICSGFFFFLSLSLNQEVKFNISLSQDKSHLQFSLFLYSFPPSLN